MRLQKYLSACGVASRRAAEDLMREGRVRVNGVVIDQMGALVAEGDEVCVDGRPVFPSAARRTILLYKPVAVMTTMSDPEGRRTVRDLLLEVPERVVPVGRLDWDTEGLLLLTDDGALCHALTHPSVEVPKEYTARVRPCPNVSALQALRAGVVMEGDPRPTAPAQVVCVPRPGGIADVAVTIHEGRNRQVRRMLAAVGLEVLSLRRTGLAFLRLNDMKPGEYRDLTPGELQKLRRIARLSDAQARDGVGGPTSDGGDRA